MKMYLLVVSLFFLVGCTIIQSRTVTLTPLDEVSDTLYVAQDSSVVCRVYMSANPGIYSDYITASVTNQAGDVQPFEYITSSVVSYKGTLSESNVTVVVHAQTTCPVGNYLLTIYADNSGVKSSIQYHLRVK